MEILPSTVECLPGLCKANSEGQIHSLLYIEMVSEYGSHVSGHIDLADRVSKLYWKERMDNSRWLIPTLTDLTFHSKGQVNYCSSSNWEVDIKDTVVTLKHRYITSKNAEKQSKLPQNCLQQT